jgi:hypothetical protein
MSTRCRRWLAGLGESLAAHDPGKANGEQNARKSLVLSHNASPSSIREVLGSVFLAVSLQSFQLLKQYAIS